MRTSVIDGGEMVRVTGGGGVTVELAQGWWWWCSLYCSLLPKNWDNLYTLYTHKMWEAWLIFCYCGRQHCLFLFFKSNVLLGINLPHLPIGEFPFPDLDCKLISFPLPNISDIYCSWQAAGVLLPCCFVHRSLGYRWNDIVEQIATYRRKRK